jgi:acetoin:2,6-dichlorophenolindophenol oxidoreductase subunit beta
MTRELHQNEAILEAIDQCMEDDPSVFIYGLGVPDPKGIFGTTLGLQQKFGRDRVMDMPCAENAMTGVAIGSALAGLRPIITHQRVDFALLSMDQVVNQAAKWHYMFSGQKSIPLVIRMIIGRGWGQGPQHAQSLESWFAHIPGLKVVAPTTPYDAKGLLIASIRDNNPVIFFEHRWLHNISGDVPKERYTVPIGKGKIVMEGTDVTIVTFSYMVLESMKAAEFLKERGIHCEIIDLRTLRPLDTELFLASVRKTGRLVVVDNDWKTGGIGAEIVSVVAEHDIRCLKEAPVRIAFPECPSPTSPALSAAYYPRAKDIVKTVMRLMMREIRDDEIPSMHAGPLDIPDASFTGPF